MIFKKIMLVALSCVILVLGCACSFISQASGPSETPVQEEILSGSQFVGRGYQIRMVITPRRAQSLDPLLFEIYVDANGNGEGKLGYKDDVYQVILISDKVYVQVSSNIVAHISDLSAHMFPTTLDVAGSASIGALGYTISNGVVDQFNYSDDYNHFQGAFAVCEQVFTPTTVPVGNTMDLSTFTQNILLGTWGTYVDPTVVATEEPVTKKESFYNNSEDGVTIHGQTYSIGDYCNYDTFFEGITPEGLLPSYAYRGDDKVEMVTVTYVSPDGKTAFMTTDGYVQSVSTSCPFTFLDFTYGMSKEDLQYLLGVKVSKKDKETWEPVREGFEYISAESGGGYLCSYKDYDIHFGVDKKTGVLTSITLEHKLDFI